MRLLPINKCSADQHQAIRMAEMVLNSPEFKTWFIGASFTELDSRANQTGLELFDKYFKNNEPRFGWYVVNRPWYKRFTTAIGWTDGHIVSTYTQCYNIMTLPERAGHIAHELMHVLGFSHSFKASPVRARSLPYQVGDYVELAVKLMTK